MGLTDSSTGSKDNSYDDDPYGQIKAQQEGEVNPWKFASGFYDSSANLYHFGARYYDPKLGRWTQQDPVGGSLGDLGSANRYVYAGDDPVNAVDPSGKDYYSCLYTEISGLIAELLGIAGVGAAGIQLAGIEATLTALAAEGASEAIIATATTTVLSATIFFWVTAGGLVATLIAILVGITIFCLLS